MSSTGLSSLARAAVAPSGRSAGTLRRTSSDGTRLLASPRPYTRWCRRGPLQATRSRRKRSPGMWPLWRAPCARRPWARSTPTSWSNLGRLARSCTGSAPSQETFDAILSFANQLSSQLSDAAGPSDQEALARLNNCWAEVRLGLSKALLNERNDAYYELRKAIRDEHEISLDLLRSHEADPACSGGSGAPGRSPAYWRCGRATRTAPTPAGTTSTLPRQNRTSTCEGSARTGTSPIARALRPGHSAQVGLAGPSWKWLARSIREVVRSQ